MTGSQAKYKDPEYRSNYERELRKRNPAFAERQRENARQWTNRNRARKRSVNKDYHESGRYREKFLNRWGLTLMDEPKNCHICNCSAGDRSLSLDHNHETGLPRGFLCQQCNIAIGHFKDSEELLNKALEYLRNPPLINKGHLYQHKPCTTPDCKHLAAIKASNELE